MALSWIAVAASTGLVIAPLPGVRVTRVSSVLGDVTTCDGYIPVGSFPEDWARATTGRGSFLVLLDDHQSKTVPVPLWGGWVMRRTRCLGPELRVTLASLEGWLDSYRITTDRTFTATSQTEIAATLVEEFALSGPHPLPLRIDAQPSTRLRDKTYEAKTNKPVLVALQELSAIEGGPEFTITWEWQHDPERITPVLTIADRIGTEPVPGLAPAATFSTTRKGMVVEASLTEDYSHGQYASNVMTWSSGVGQARPQSTPQTFTDDIRPDVQFWHYPGSDITEQATLDAYARQYLDRMRHGGTALSITAVMDKAPRLARDWRIGDDLAYRIGGTVSSPATQMVDDAYTDTYTDAYRARAKVKRHPNGIDSAPQFPGGLNGTARCVGWHLDPAEPATVTPILELGGDT